MLLQDKQFSEAQRSVIDRNPPNWNCCYFLAMWMVWPFWSQEIAKHFTLEASTAQVRRVVLLNEVTQGNMIGLPQDDLRLQPTND